MAFLAATHGRRSGWCRPPQHPPVGALPRTPNGAWWLLNLVWLCHGCGRCVVVAVGAQRAAPVLVLLFRVMVLGSWLLTADC